MILLSDLGQAFGNLRAQKTRTFLTAIGIVFGVGSVIGMMAIGAGAREESLRFIEQLGVRNILIDSRPAMSQEELQQRRRSSPGLSERDVRILQANIDAVELMSARRTLHPAAALPKPSRDIPELYGVRPAYSAIHSLQFAEGRFFDDSDDDRSALVCVLGEGAKVNMLGYDPAVGKFVKVNDTWLEVVGVLKEQLMAGSQSSGGTMQDINNIIYVPANTFQYRFWDRSANMRDDLDGIELRLRPGGGQHRGGQGGDGGAELHASRYPGFHRDDSGGAARPAATHAENLHLRDGGDRGHFPAGGRHRHHEHRAGDGAGADAGDRHPAFRWARGGGISCGSS